MQRSPLVAPITALLWGAAALFAACSDETSESRPNGGGALPTTSTDTTSTTTPSTTSSSSSTSATSSTTSSAGGEGGSGGGEGGGGTGGTGGAPEPGPLYGDGAWQGASDVDVDSVGNRLMAGAFVGAIDFGAGSVASAGLSDGFVVKLAPDGTPAWSRAIGDAANQYGAAVAVDHQDRVALFGTFEGTVGFGGSDLTADGDRDLYLALLDSSNVHVHSRRIPWGSTTIDGAGWQVAVGPSDELVVATSFVGSVTPGSVAITSAGGADGFVASYDAAGAPQWSRGFGSAASERQADVAIDGTGNVLLVGAFNGTLDFGCGPLTAATGFDAYVVKLDSQGDCVWSKAFAGTGDELASSVAADASGNLYVAAVTDYGIDFGGGLVSSSSPAPARCAVAKLGPDGSLLWDASFGCAMEQIGAQVAADSAGALLVTGKYSGTTELGGNTHTAEGGLDLLVWKIDATGTSAYDATFGSTGSDGGSAIVADVDDDLVVVGWASGDIDFGEGLVPGHGDADAFLVSLTP